MHKQWATFSEKELVCARASGRLLLEGPSTRARENIIKEVNACPDDNDRHNQLGNVYLDHYVRLCELLSLTFQFSL